MMTQKQAAAFSPGGELFHKDDIASISELVTVGGLRCMVSDINAYVYPKLKKILSLICSVFVCLFIHLFSLLSSCLERNCLENCEREVELEANNQIFC